MRLMHIAAFAVVVAGLTMAAFARDVPESGPAVDGSPAWFTDHASDIHVHNYETMCAGDTAKFCMGKTGEALRICLSSNKSRVSATCQTALAMPWQEGGFDISRTPPCVHSVICAARAANNPDGANGGVGVVNRVEWKSDPPNMGYKSSIPINCPRAAAAHLGGAGFQGQSLGLPAFAAGHAGIVQVRSRPQASARVGDKELGAHQDKAHGLAWMRKTMSGSAMPMARR